MGKKYIIELEDKPFNKGNGDFLYRVKGFNSLVFDMTGVGKLTPYTEPDLEQVRKDAWEAARKIVALSTVDRREVFGSEHMYIILNKHTASEAIEKLKAYEQEQDAEINVGDEVIAAFGKAVVMGVGPVYLEYVYANGHIGSDKIENVKKTGRHFPEIAAVLQKMKE